MATAQELIDRIRFDYLSDSFDGYEDATQAERDLNVLWTDTRLLVLLNDAHQESCIRGEIMTEDTPFTMKIEVLTNGYDVDHRIAQLRHVRMESQDTPELIHVSRTDMENNKFPDFKTATGEPTHYYMHGYKMFLYPTPIIADTITLECYAYPDDMDLTDEPTIPLGMHKDLIWWVLTQAFSKPDADGYDPSRVDFYEKKFDRAFGPQIDNRVIVHQLENPRHDNYIGGISYLDNTNKDSSNDW